MSGKGLLLGAPIVCAAAACPAYAADEISFDVPSGPLNVALLSYASQARISIDTSDPALRSIRVGGLKGRFSLREGLRRLLKGTGYDYLVSRGNVVRVLRQTNHPSQRVAPDRGRAATSPSSPRPGVQAPPSAEIIVTSSKQNVALVDYPGTFHVTSFTEGQSLHAGGSGSEVLLRKLPNLTSTNLGSGRNKIFIRGIADSSFNGQLQSTVSQYFGESRLTYSAPDPDLALYDIEKVEVIEGPQGTLYGAGSLGGVIRVVPRLPIPGEFSLSGTAAMGATGGKVGGDSAVVTNIPIGRHAALRIVGYRIVRPGYIDDVERNLSDINRTSVSGLRASMRMEFRDGLSIDAGIVTQDTGSRDSQYIDGPPSSTLTRRSLVAQPFNNDYRLAFGTFRADLGFAKLVSNTSYTYHTIDTVFDATSPVAKIPSIFEESMLVRLLTHETRISGSSDWISNWVSGFSIARNTNRIDRFLGPPDAPATIANIHSETLDAALFGEATLRVWRNFSINGGGRLSLFRRTDAFNIESNQAVVEPPSPEMRFLPTAALSWKPWKGTIGYIRYQEGFRSGAQQLTGSGDQAAVTRFQPDEIRTFEIGSRFGQNAGSQLSGGLSYAYSRWNRVQADLVTSTGFPYVANLGSAHVHYISADLVWKPSSELGLELSGFQTISVLDRPSPNFEGEEEEALPNVADGGWRLSGRYEPWIGTTKITLDGSVGYVGTSVLGVSAPFDIPQGNYLDTAIGAKADFGRWGLSLDIENLLDSRANRFSYGNPFSVANGDQRTPLRPRTIRLGIDARF
ncbi:TonB-dependent receptor plug domain-containing protein [Novosphingobium mathurense]|uniref:Outer membrane receptor proteins, mostly Fe transport n=1 Tax=Novosphingobium mathurense TaxID=428990 RepID=A0A1U6H3C5_9SPHN|nr:TonB-dependent receptor [Novosphingobium mathurense]SLJ90253.1 Outer membrane receptor proteins, mostly Fe transport [Novosphingobium mathurense]